MFKETIFVAGLALAGLAGAASAATVEFVGTGQGATYTITFDDNTTGQIGVNITATGAPADMLGLGFDWNGSALDTTLGTGDFVFVSSNTGEGIEAICTAPTGVSQCGTNANNFNGNGNNPPIGIFDYMIQMGSQGAGQPGAVTQFAFYITTDDMLEDVLDDSFGIRAQGTGPDGKDSIKLVDFTRVPTPQVPLPAAGLLMIGALGGLGAMRRRKAQKVA